MPSLMLIVETCERHVYPLGKATLMVGREHSSTIQLPSDSISPNHATIVFEDNQFVLHDNGSSNGSFVNGEAVTKRILKNNDIVRFGEYVFLVDLDDTSAKLIPTAELKEIKNPSRITSNVSYQEIVELSKKPAVQAKAAKGGGLKLLLTESVAKQKTSSTKIPVQPSNFRNIAIEMTKAACVTLVAAALTVCLTVYLLPLGAREAVIQTEDFKSLPFQSSLHDLLIRENTSFTDEAVLKEGSTFGTKVTVPKSSHLLGSLFFTQKIPSAFRVKVQMGQQQGKNTNPILSQILEITPDMKSFDLFSALLPPGNYNLECSVEGGPIDPGAPATFLIKTKS